MKTPSNKYIISVPKEQTFSNSNLIVPINKGTEETNLRPVSGIICGLPMKLTPQFGIASNTGSTMLNAKLLEKSVEMLKNGDEVYISYMATDSENFLYSDEKSNFFVVPIHHLIAVKENGKPKAIAGKILIKPVEKAEFESKLLISPHKIKHIGVGEVVSCATGMRDYYEENTKVAYLEKLAEWIEIENVKYDFVYTGEILATI